MPAASHVEKAGTFTNTQRLVQLRDKALDPPGDARSELWFMHHLFKRVQAHYAGSSDHARLADPQPQLGLRRARPARASRDVEDVMREINGYDVATRRAGRRLRRARRTTARPRAAAGSTPASSPTASTRRGAATRATSTSQGGSVSPEWAWAWPANRRILYNRASRRPRRQAVVGAQEVRLVGRGAEQWTGYDVPDFPVDKPPDYKRAAPTPRAWTRSPATDPFIMMADGRAWLYSPSRPARRPDADALRADRVAGRQPALPGDPATNPAALRWTRRRTRTPSPATRATRTWPRPSG